MKTMIKFAMLAVCAMLFIPALAPAQIPGVTGAARMYDPATETTLKGTVEAVKQRRRGQMMGMRLTLNVGEENRDIILGPSRFIRSQGFSFAKGDRIEVTACKIIVREKDHYLAREVVKDGKALTLRDKSGMPQWAGKGMGRGRPG